LQIRQTPDITATVPNLTVARNDTYSNSTIVLRSITQANNSDVPVAVIVDGVPQDDSKQFNTYLFDIAQIEVLKGPQGSLYGRNAEAGAIIITTAPPPTSSRDTPMCPTATAKPWMPERASRELSYQIASCSVWPATTRIATA
jgi:outer membrane receptor protein involved in Fe transport